MSAEVFSPGEAGIIDRALSTYRGSFIDRESRDAIEAMRAKVAKLAPSRVAWKRYGGRGVCGQGYQTRVGSRVFTVWPIADGWNASVHIHGASGDDGATRVAGHGRTRNEAFESAAVSS